MARETLVYDRVTGRVIPKDEFLALQAKRDKAKPRRPAFLPNHVTRGSWVMVGGKLVSKDEHYAAMPVRPAGPYLQSDYAAYKSPLGDGWIEGRAAKREHHKRTNTRHVDPSEYKSAVRNQHRAARLGIPVTGDPLPTPRRLPTVIDENWRE